MIAASESSLQEIASDYVDELIDANSSLDIINEVKLSAESKKKEIETISEKTSTSNASSSSEDDQRQISA